MRLSRRALFGVPAAGLLAVGFLALFERVEVEQPTGPRPVARANRRLAAQRFLTAMGSPARSERVLVLPNEETPLLSFTPPGTLRAEEAAVLGDWVQRGGTLVTTPQPTLAARLGLPAADAPARQDGPARISTPAGGSYLVWMPASPRFGAAGPTVTTLGTGSVGPAEGKRPGGVVAVAREVGKGRVVLLASDAFAHNQRLGDGDHAAFLWALVGGHGPPAAVRIVAWDEPTSLRALLLARGWPLLVAIGLLVGAWAWRAGVRTGPVLAAEPPPRRSLLEHVRASGELLWRLGEREALLAGLREAVRRRMALRHPGWAALPPRQQVQRLAETSSTAGGWLAPALGGPAPEDGPAFLRAVQVLHRAWRSL